MVESPVPTVDYAASGAFIVGLTGGIGSGKSTVADLFTTHGVTLVDTDRIAHELTTSGGAAMPAIEHAFGTGVIAPDGSLDRAAMRSLVFERPEQRQRLESILHPLIRRESERQVAQATSAYVILAVPLLVESGRWQERVHRVLVIDCLPDVQVSRVMQRSGLAREQVEAIIAVQASRQQRLAAADDVIDNNGTPDALPGAVAQLHERYLELARAHRSSP
jgi:dephospho-CoA kinase